jgi:hypothetical protein
MIDRPTYYADWKDVPASEWRWASFSPAEIACRGTGKLLIDPEALDKLQALRDSLGKPLIVNSGYRSPEHNKAVGGAMPGPGKHGSYHLDGVAFDIAMSNHDPARFEAAARNAGFTGIGHYPMKRDGRWNFMHIDTGPARFWTGDGRRFPAASQMFTPEPREDLTTAMSKNAPAAAGGAGLTAAAAVAPTALEKVESIPFTTLSEPVQLALVLGGIGLAGLVLWLAGKAAVRRGWI